MASRATEKPGLEYQAAPSNGKPRPEDLYQTAGSLSQGRGMNLRVECYSGFKADERPVRFELNGTVYLVEELLDQWYGPRDTYFKIRADDGNLYILRHDTFAPEGAWSLESFRRLVVLS